MSWMCGCTLLLGVLLACSIGQTSGYGFLHTPRSRGTVGYPSPINPFHMYNFCSYCDDFSRRPVPSARCGICGDLLNGPRDHEAGGKYATGKITGSYKSGATIPVTVLLRPKEIGWIEFRLCPVTNPNSEVTQQCLNQNLLEFDDGTMRRKVRQSEFVIDMKLKLPDKVTCTHCVLQWKYHGGDFPRADDYGDFDVSDCELEFEYYNCADISISGTSSMLSNPAPKTNPVTKPTTKPVTQPVTKPVTLPVTKPATKIVTQPVTKPVAMPIPVKITETKPFGKCVPVGNWVNQPGMLTWCIDNCARGHCPSEMCAC